MSDPTGAVAAEATAPEAAPAGPDLSPINDRMDQLANGVGEMRQTIEQFVQSQQPPPAPEVDPWTTIFGAEPNDNEFQTQAPVQPQFDPAALKTAMEQAIRDSNAPLLQRLQNFELQQAASTLGQMIPQLASHTPELKAANKDTIAATDTLVRQSIAHYPAQIQAALLVDPNYIAQVFKAAEAEKLAQGQTPAGGPVPTLEAAGGAHPGGNGEQANPVHQIYGNRAQEIPKGFR